MGKPRLMVSSLVTAAANVTPSSQAAGVVTRAQKEGTGAAVMTTEGAYSGTVDADYLAQVDAAGEVGTATFMWSDNDGDTIEGAGVATAAVLQELSSDVQVAWTGGSGTDCALGDVWRFKGVLPYGKAKMLDHDRDSVFRSGDCTGGNVTVALDCGAGATPQVLVVLDHNFSATAEIRLQSSETADFAALTDDDAVAYRAGHLLHYLGAPARTHRYWRLLVRDLANADGYLEFSELYLGPYVEPTRGPELGDVQSRARLADRRRAPSGRYTGGLNAEVREFSLTWGYLSAADRTALAGAFSALSDAANRAVRQVFFNLDSDDLSTLYFCEWDGTFDEQTEPDAPERYRVAVRLVEIPQTT